MSTESKPISTMKFILKYGLIWGALWSIYFYFRFIEDNIYTINWFFSSFEIILYISIIYPIFRYRNLNNNTLNLQKALIIGTSISIISHLILIICNIVLVEIIQSEHIIQTLGNIKEEMLINNPKMSPIDIQETMRFNKISNLFGGFILSTTFSFAISLVAGAILYKKKKL